MTARPPGMLGNTPRPDGRAPALIRRESLQGAVNAIEADGLTRDFGAKRAVDGLDLRVPQGSVYGFLGPNGAGKTTTLHMLLGILRPSAGSATVAGFDVASEAATVRRRCGALLEHNGLYEKLSALENLELQGRMHRMPPHERASRARELLDEMGLHERRNELVGTWSRGMKQQLAIARAMFARPTVLFLDEPTAGHDPQAAAALRQQMKALARSGVTVFLTTHNLHEAEEVCDEVAVLRDGRRIAAGPPHGLRSDGRIRVQVRGGPFGKLRLGRNVEQWHVEDGLLKATLRPKAGAADLVKSLVKQGIAVEEVRHVHSLERDFLDLMAGGGDA
jgi:ABC-2 type transport system ATP-binding protein